MTIRTYLRSNLTSETFPLLAQHTGCRALVNALGLDGEPVVEYIDEHASAEGDQRAGLRRLVAEARPEDIIVCRDPSRLDRSVTRVEHFIAAMVRDRGCRLFFYASGEEVR